MSFDLYAGFDGGGSRTTCCLTDENGRLLGMGSGGPLNYLFCGKETAHQSITDALSGAFSAADLAPRPLKGCFVSSAAILLGHGDGHRDFFDECIQAEQLTCDSDILPVWFGGTRFGPAVVVIAGTGSIAYNCKEDHFMRVGGWGPLLGDEGSGYDLGRRALQTAARMSDGRLPTDPLFLTEMLGFYQVSQAHGLISAVNKADSRERIAGCAKLVFELADGGNQTAEALITQTVDELVLLIETTQAKSGEERLPVILSGGLASPVLPRLQVRVPGDLRLLNAKPAVAAAAIALYRAGDQAAADRLVTEEVI